MATNGNDTCFSDTVAFQGLETLGLPYVEHVEEQSLVHQVCLRSILCLLTGFGKSYTSSAFCSGPPELSFVSERSGRAIREVQFLLRMEDQVRV